MKKFILIVLFSFSIQAVVFGQSIQITDYSGAPITDTLVFWHADDPNRTEAPTEFERKNFARITNVSNDSLTIKMMRKAITVIPGAQDLACWGGECLGPNDPVLSPNWDFPVDITLDSNQYASGINAFILYFFSQDNYGDAIFNYKFYNLEDPNDSASVFVKWSISLLTDINEISKAVQKMDVYPNPATSEFTIDLNAGIKASNQEIIIRDMLGKTISRTTIQAMQETHRFSTEELTGGIYFVSYALNGEVLKTKKLIVK